jgi:GNAT superfamily N-acetyltransferase
LQLVRLSVDKPQPAVAFLHARSRGVMDLIAHFWEGLAATPPLQRGDLHLVVAAPASAENNQINIYQHDPDSFSGAMLYVPKAHRADVLALDAPTAAAFASYICHQGAKARAEGAEAPAASEAAGVSEKSAAAGMDGVEMGEPITLPLTDFSSTARHGTPDQTAIPAEPSPLATAGRGGNGGNGVGNGGRVAIDFLTGAADGIRWMTPLLLPLVHKRAPARELTNVVMQLPAEITCGPDPHVRPARESDIPTLNRWRRLYKEERGIHFDADMDALVQNQRVFVYELSGQVPANGAAGSAPGNGGGEAAGAAPGSSVVAVAKFDLDLRTLIEIGGVYTFPEHRHHGYGAALMSDLAHRIRQAGKVPTLQVDEANLPALGLYEKTGWKAMGKLARVWLTG